MGPVKKFEDIRQIKNKKKIFVRLLSYLKKYRFSLIFVNLFCVIGIILNAISPKLSGNIITQIFNDVNSNKAIDMNFVFNTLAFIALIYLFSSIFLYLQSFIITKVCQNAIFNLRKDIDNKLVSLPLSYFDSNTKGNILSTITNDVETINSSLQQMLTQVINTFVTLISIIVMMLTISPLMTFIIFLTLPLTGLFTKKVISKSQVYFMSQQNMLAQINSHVEEMYSGHQIITLFNKEKQSIDKLREINEEWYGYSYKAQFLSGLILPIVHFISNIGYLAVAVIGSILAINNYITVGNIQSFIEYVRQFNHPISQVANIFNMFQSTLAASNRIFSLLDEEELVLDKEHLASLDDVSGNVEFKNVKFGYRPEKILINDISFSVESGKTVAIVGPTGAGKTTIINLLLRFYDVNSGNILIDGTSIYDVTRHDLRKHFGMVLQDTWLFNGTIRENIRYSNLNASDEDVENAAKASYAHHFIQTLPGGYDFVLNEEVNNISEGQKQLLTIARAILSNPKILILDEATSNVDTRTEILIQKAMNKLMQGRTSFVIAHRLSTIRDADMILVLKDGDIVEKGSHDYLLENGVYYKELYKSQFEN